MKTNRKNQPKRKGPRITVQLDDGVDKIVREMAGQEFATVSEKGRLSAFVRKAIGFKRQHGSSRLSRISLLSAFIGYRERGNHY